MTMTDYQDQTNYHVQGHPDQLGSLSPGAPTSRRRRNTEPEYRNSILSRPEVRALVADACRAQVDELNGSPSAFGVSLIVDQLTKVIDELRSA